jgi:hypothetical protein
VAAVFPYDQKGLPAEERSHAPFAEKEGVMDRNQSGQNFSGLAGLASLALPVGAIVALAGAVGIGVSLYMRSHRKKHWYSFVPAVWALVNSKDLIHSARDLMHGAKGIVHSAQRVWN